MTKTKTKTIRVTKHDIANGARQDHLSCPVALALKRQHPQIKWDIGHCWINANHSMKTPERVGAFIQEFDDGKPVKPFSFRIRL